MDILFLFWFFFFVLFLVFFFLFSLSLNKCHFLRQKEGTVNILDTLFFGVGSAPGAVSLPPQTLMHFPNLVTSFLKAFLPQPNLQVSQGAKNMTGLICWTKSTGRTPE